MSILIKGMKMPNACYECEFYNEVCPFDGVGVWHDPLRECADGCPLLELPEHGDLIDRDELMKHGVDMPCDGGNLPLVYMSYVKGAKAVIPAERSEEECEDENWYTELDDPKIAERSEE